jgi:apolipoprotein N-acyltransferase
LLTGNPWILLGYSQFGVAPLVQIADVTGVYGVSFVLAAVNAALAEACVGLFAERRLTRRAAGGLVLAAACVALTVSYGRLRLDQPVSDSDATAVGVVQANLDLGAQWDEQLRGRNLDLYGRLTIDLLRRSPVPLVVWPETALTFFLDGDDGAPYRESIASLLRPGQVQLVTGGPHVIEAATAPTFFNSAFVVAPDGAVLARYDKQHLLPFAEYFPLPRLDFLRRDFGRVREFASGAATPPLPTVAGRAGVLICNEGLFPEIAAQRVREGAQYLINLSNDTWLNDRTYSEITFNMLGFRAIEQRRYLVRASSSGPSAIVDPRGRVLARSEPLSEAVLHGAIAPRDQRTPYSRIGDVFVFACAAVVILTLLWDAYARR